MKQGHLLGGVLLYNDEEVRYMDEELDDMLIAEEYDRKYKNGEVELVDFDEFVKDRKEKYDL